MTSFGGGGWGCRHGKKGGLWAWEKGGGAVGIDGGAVGMEEVGTGGKLPRGKKEKRTGGGKGMGKRQKGESTKMENA